MNMLRSCFKSSAVMINEKRASRRLVADVDIVCFFQQTAKCGGATRPRRFLSVRKQEP